jgi:hypothetical protein
MVWNVTIQVKDGKHYIDINDNEKVVFDSPLDAVLYLKTLKETSEGIRLFWRSSV